MKKPSSGLGLEFVVDVGLLHDAVSRVARLDLCIDRERLAGFRVAPYVMVPFPSTLKSAAVLFEDLLHYRSEV
jgi:hypothetical protein